MESKTSTRAGGATDVGPFGLDDLCVLLNRDTAGLTLLLAGLHEIRDDGIYPLRLTDSEAVLALHPPFEVDGLPQGWRDGPLRLTRGNLSQPALPIPFRWADLLRFFQLRPDIAQLEVEGRFTNDPGLADPRPPIDDAAFRLLEVQCADLARLLRPLLEAGAGGPWWRSVDLGDGESDRAMPVMLANEKMVRDALATVLAEHGLTKLPPLTPGRRDLVKAAVQERTKLGDDRFQHAWKAVTRGMRSTSDRKP